MSQGLNFGEQYHKQGHVLADSFLEVAFLTAVVGQFCDVLFILFLDVGQADDFVLEHFEVDLECGLVDLAQSLNLIAQGSHFHLEFSLMLCDCLFVPIVFLTLDPLAADDLL